MSNCECCGWYNYNADEGLICNKCLKENKDTRWMANRTEAECKVDEKDGTWMIIGENEDSIDIANHLENKIMLELRKRYT